MKKIIVTDGFTLNGGDLSWQPIEQFGALTVYDRTPQELIVERCHAAEMVLTNKVPFTKETLAQLPQLRFIGVLATGYNIVDTAADAQGIVVCNVPGYGTASVAQHTFALILECANNVGRNSASVAAGRWVKAADWCYSERPILELAGKTIGVVGMGNIGQQVARIAAAFDMQVIYFNPSKKTTEVGKPCSMDELFRQSDVVTLHCPPKADNLGFVNQRLLQQMKPAAYLVNTSRGSLINEADLALALNEGWIAGAALDVLSTEPPTADNPLLRASNCIITPHNAWMSREARQRIMEVTAQNISAFLNGQPQNKVNQ